MLRIVLLALLISGCDNQRKQDNESKRPALYEIICKHPMGHVVRLTLTEREWKSPYGRAIFNFVDVNGVKHIYANCHTNSNMRVIKH